MSDLVIPDMSDFSPDYVSRIHPPPDDPRVRFKFRARFVGVNAYTCIFCGFPNSLNMSAKTYSARCNNLKCRRYMGFGQIAYIIGRGPQAAPPDLVIPRTLLESFPEGDIGRWTTGQPIHEVAVLKWPAPPPQPE